MYVNCILMINLWYSVGYQYESYDFQNHVQTMRKTKQEALQTRNNLLETALIVFYDRGVAQASLDEIAKTAGVTRGALYWHFKNKEDLFDALFQKHFADIEQHLEQSSQPAHSDDPLTALYNGMLDHCQSLVSSNEIRKFATILNFKCEQTKHNQGIIELSHQYHRRWDQLLINILQESKRQGLLPKNLNVERALLLLTSTIGGLAVNWLASPERFNLMAHAPAIIQTCFDNLKNSPHLRDEDI